MAEIEKLEMRAAEDRARLKIALEALGSSTSKSAKLKGGRLVRTTCSAGTLIITFARIYNN